MLTSRQAALDLIIPVLQKGRMLEHELPSLARLSDSRDRAFARKAAATVLRRYGQISVLIDNLTDRPLRPGTARWCLALGVAQLLFMRVPDHAAVDSTVRLAATNRAQSLKGLLNAVLRRITKMRHELVLGPTNLNLPPWLRESWETEFGPTETEIMANLFMQDPPLDLTSRTPQAHHTLLARLTALKIKAHPVGLGSIRLSETSMVTELPGYESGAWWVQDAAAAIPAHLLHVKPGMRVIDLCAAPGGKTAQLSAGGANVIAVDQGADRLALLRNTLNRLALKAVLIDADATRWQPSEPVSALLLDAPCTATGTIRRHPDILHRKQMKDVIASAKLQDRLLDQAANMIAPGGQMVFSTCSLQPEEGRIRITRFLQKHPSFQLDPITETELGPIFSAARTINGDVRIIPTLIPESGVDGFYIARLRRANR